MTETLKPGDKVRHRKTKNLGTVEWLSLYEQVGVSWDGGGSWAYYRQEFDEQFEILPPDEVPPFGLSAAWTDSDDCYSETDNTSSQPIRWYNPATHKLIPVADYVGPEEFAEFVFYHFGGAWKRPKDIHPGYGPRMAKLPKSVERIVSRMAGESNGKHVDAALKQLEKDNG